MGKMKVTKKGIKEGYENIIKVGYCDIQSLLAYKDAKFYSSGVYGWSCDYYVINDNTIICTGYDPIGNIKPDYNTIREYEAKARKILNNRDLSYEKQMKKLDNLLNSFVSEVEG